MGLPVKNPFEPKHTPPPRSVKAASWMKPGAPRVQKPSWLRMAPAVVETPVIPQVEVLSSEPPPRSFRAPSMPPPSSRGHHPTAQIQTTRELELESELVHLHNEFQRIFHENETMQARVMEESEPAIVALALAIAKRVVGRELTADATLVHAWVREAQGLMPAGSVHVAPGIEGVEGAVIDPTLPPGTAEVRNGGSVIAVGADARIAAMADALGVDQ